MENLKRYEPMWLPYDRGSVKMDEDCEGNWVKFDDIKEVLKTSHNTAHESISLIDDVIKTLSIVGMRNLEIKKLNLAKKKLLHA